MTFKQFVWDIFFKNDKAFVLSNIDTDEELQAAMLQVAKLGEALEALEEEAREYERALEELTNDLVALEDQYAEEEELEAFWNDKRPKTMWTHYARPQPDNPDKRVSVDPRIFYQNDGLLPSIEGDNTDQIAIRCYNYVVENITYTLDDKEYWQFAYETLRRGKGDCEDGAILMANMMLLSGVPYWRIRLNAGDVEGGGHAYVTYLRETDNEWYILDWCYWPSESANFKKKWKDAQKYFGIWGSWNTKYIYGVKPTD